MQETIGDVYFTRYSNQNSEPFLVKEGDSIYLNDKIITSSNAMLLAYSPINEQFITASPLSSVEFSTTLINKKQGNSYSSAVFGDEQKAEDDSEKFSLLEKLLSQEEDIESILDQPSAPSSSYNNIESSGYSAQLGSVIIWERTGNEIIPVGSYLSDADDEEINFLNNEIDSRTLFGPEMLFQPSAIITARPDALIVSEDSLSNIGNVATNDTNSVSTSLTYSLVLGRDVSHGVLFFNSNGTYNYRPNANFSGSDSFEYQVVDSDGNASTSTVNITILPIADLVSVPQTESATEDIVFSSNVSSGNSTTSGGSLIYTLVSGPAHGVLTNPINISTGDYSYTPNLHFNGVDSFQYLVTDAASNESSVQTVTINLAAVDDIPDGTDSSVTINEDSTHVFDVSDFGFSDVDGDSFQAVRVDTLASSGVLWLSGVPIVATQIISAVDIAAGNLSFVPDLNDNGVPYGSFTFTVQDSNNTFDDVPNTLTLNVTPINDAPTSADKAIVLDEDDSHTLLISDFAFSDVEGDTFASIRIDSLPLAGQLTLAGLAVALNQVITVASIISGDLVFTPAENANGVAYGSFTFSVQDSAGSINTSPNTISFDVTPVADLPVALDDSYDVIVSTPFTSTLVNGVLLNDSDADGDILTVNTTPISDTANGVLVLNGNGTFSYTPNLGFNGSDSFIYEVNDGTGNTTQAAVSINVDYVSNTIVGTSAGDNLIGAAASDDDIFSGGVGLGSSENVQGVAGTVGYAQGAHVGSGNDRLIFDADDTFVTDASASGGGGHIRIRDFTVGDVTTDPDADTLVLGDFLRAGDPTFDGTAADAVRFLHFVDVFSSRGQLLYIDRDGGLGAAGSAARALSEPSVYRGIDGGASLVLEFKGSAYDATPGGEVLNTETHIQNLMNLGYLDFS